MTNPKKQWFDVLDSKTKKEGGNGFFYNVEARFSDHPVINIEKSKVARHAVYEWSIVLHTRVKRIADGAMAQKNMSAQTLRFDKGEAMGELDFEAAKKAIMRCWDAWEHYCTWREAPVTTAEIMALEQIEHAPLSALGTVKVLGRDGKLVDARRAGDDEDEDEDDDEIAQLVTAPRKAANKAARERPASPVAGRKGKRTA